MQAIDLVNGVFLARGDTAIIEQECYQGSINRLTRLGVNTIGIPLDRDGMRMDALSNALDDLKHRGMRRNTSTPSRPCRTRPAASCRKRAAPNCLKLSEAHGVPVFEDDCYADLIWDGKRPPAIYAMSRNGGVVHIGSFSKSIAPALRVGYIVAGWDILSRALVDQDRRAAPARSSRWCLRNIARRISPSTCSDLTRGLRVKLDTLMEALNEQFGTAAEFEEPKGGIFLWVKLPDNVDTLKLYQPALKAGVAINPGPEWSVDKAYSKSRMRLCFASPTLDEIREGVAALAEVCSREFGVPTRSANVARAGS